MADPDAALMQAFQRGDESAFETLVGRHRDRVFRLAYRYLGEASSAEDLAQETFLRVYRTRSSWRPEAKFSTWLYRVTANACLNEIRARRARRAVETTAPAAAGGAVAPEPADPAAPDPAGEALRAETAAVVREAVAALDEDQRTAVLLSKYEGLSYRELADAMQRSVPAVKSLLVRARANLRQALAGHLDRAPSDPDGAGGGASAVDRRREARRAARAAGATEGSAEDVR
jgi:RNA polymerase sigma-70 factor (ECF subfamily)